MLARRYFLVPVLILGLMLSACAAPAAAPSAGEAADRPAEDFQTVLGDALPDDAAPYSQQILRLMLTREPACMERASSCFSFLSFYHAEPLARITEDQELVGAIAESWDVSDDGLTWTFNIRPGLEWSDGEALNAEDVVFTLQRIAHPEVAFPWTWFFTDIKNLTAVNSGEMDISELGVRAIDELTVEVDMEAPAPYFPDKTSLITISPQHVIGEVNGAVDWSVDPATAVSGGAWKLARWEKGKEIVWEANDNYKGVWRPSLKEIHLIVGAGEAVMPAYEAGETDVVADRSSSPADIARARSEDPERWGLNFYDDWETYMLVFNNSMEPFDNTKLRQAIARGIDKAGLASSAGRDASAPAFALLGPGFPAHNPELKDTLSFDPTAAQELLAEAGYPNAEGLGELTITTWGPLNPTRKGWIEGVQAQLKENLNIDLNIEIMEVGTFYAEKANHVFPFTFQQYQYDYIDPSNLLALFTTGNYDYSNPEYDELIEAADHYVGPVEERMALYQEAEQILVEDAGGVFLYWSTRPQFWRPYVRGKSLEPNSLGVVAWRDLKLGINQHQIYITSARCDDFFPNLELCQN